MAHKSNTQVDMSVGNVAIGQAYVGNVLVYSADADKYIVLSGKTSNAGSVSVVADGSETGRKTSVSETGWKLTGDGRIAAALSKEVDFTKYSKLYFTVTENTAYQYATLGYRTDSKTWINASGVSVATKKVLNYGQTGTFFVDIKEDDASGYIILEIMNHGVGISNANGVTISEIWLE